MAMYTCMKSKKPKLLLNASTRKILSTAMKKERFCNKLKMQ